MDVTFSALRDIVHHIALAVSTDILAHLVLTQLQNSRVSAFLVTYETLIESCGNEPEIVLRSSVNDLQLTFGPMQAPQPIQVHYDDSRRTTILRKPYAHTTTPLVPSTADFDHHDATSTPFSRPIVRTST